jgi:hypothetical protein
VHTQRLLRLSPEPTTDNDALDDDNEAANDPTGTDEDRDDAAAMEDAFSGLSINDDELLEDDYCDLEKSGEGIFSTPERKTRTPNRSTIKKVRTPIRTPSNRSPIPPSPPYFRSPSLVESSVSSVSSAGAPRREDGTNKNPYVVFVDPTRPERNREFDVERVCKIKHNGYEYNGYHVRTPIAVPDYDKWEAHVPTELPRHFRGKYSRRALLVKGPAQSFWIRNQERYYKKLMWCAQTADSHTGTHLEIEADPSRFYTWYLLFGSIV